MKAFKQFTLIKKFSVPKISSFSLNCFYLHETSVVCPKHTVIPDGVVSELILLVLWLGSIRSASQMFKTNCLCIQERYLGYMVISLLKSLLH